ncbi:nucleoside triphosphate pyrophosphohydrolase [Mycobacterium intermedium]|uniref:Nucleoside triphosphate pyrophosphohydrolase n=1 Tax=Mycobacterium intermedium TaxID=28445 RepID=A0A1E3SIS2_MYCIE|nr:nucleoside triphosphate pyrophosphohydrolase [Mycobacterium intermedium]MCV6963234.1 nucleoside triphosphate pyrophosphohydrolase [Mycobacterium intermedium]ODR01458.1 nucleoside triphosphate hydrolase [Mycobacterium intermedium]OPE46437.1 nucleoside triphosphate pyrophosphohydrolase [Mycobacterium intermedium]ORB01242.1 nucleoside triphosphate pyrophosphohydrolase [Mycobacterium intermedium]
MIVVLVDPRRPSLVPVDAIELLTGPVQYTEEMPIAVPWSLPDAHPVHMGEDAPVLLSSDPEHPAVVARLVAGARLIAAPPPQRGERLLDAVAMMDKLRTNGPWESEQTHDSLRRYLLEETYELLDAVHSGSVDQLREELGDLLLQVLFHSRIAEDAAQSPFSVDDVADTLIRKLGNRVPGVLAGENISLQDQMAQWEEAKALERSRKAHHSVLDDVHTGQPALALAQKVIQRVEQAGLPAELIPEEITSISVSADVDAENTLRTAILDFTDTLRKAEAAIAAARRGDSVAEELDVTPLGVVSAEEWRAHWPVDAGWDGGAAGADDVAEDVVEVSESPEDAEVSREPRGGSKKRKGRR